MHLDLVENPSRLSPDEETIWYDGLLISQPKKWRVHRSKLFKNRKAPEWTSRSLHNYLRSGDWLSGCGLMFNLTYQLKGSCFQRVSKLIKFIEVNSVSSCLHLLVYFDWHSAGFRDSGHRKPAFQTKVSNKLSESPAYLLTLWTYVVLFLRYSHGAITGLLQLKHEIINSFQLTQVRIENLNLGQASLTNVQSRANR